MLRRTSLKFYSLLLITFALTASAQSVTQSSAATVAVVSNKLDSKLMGRGMPYEVFLPATYNANKSARFPVIYFLHGLGNSYKALGGMFASDRRLVEAFEKHQFILVAVQGGSGFYTDSASVPNDRYESYIVQELIPEIDRLLRTLAAREGRVIYGSSMGGFGAIKFGLKYPQLFSIAGSSIGALNAASWRDRNELMSLPAAKAAPNIDQVLVPIFGDGTIRTHAGSDLFQLIKNIPQEKVDGLPYFYLDCGTEDGFGFLKPNQDMAEMMVRRKIRHEFRQYPGPHALAPWVVAGFIQMAARVAESRKTGQTSPG